MDALQTFKEDLRVKGVGIIISDSELYRYLDGKCWNMYDNEFRWIGAGRMHLIPEESRIKFIMRNKEERDVQVGNRLRVCVW